MESGEVGRLREEAEHPGEAALQGLLTCRLHISELQSSLISPRWVTEALPFPHCARACVCTGCVFCVQVCSCMHVLHFRVCVFVQVFECVRTCPHVNMCICT